MKKYCLSLLLSFVTFAAAFAQTEKPINLALDYARFKMDRENSYLELYYAFSPKQMTLKKINDKSYTELLLKFVIIDTITKEILVDRMWNLRNEFMDNGNEKYLLGQSRFLLEYAPYKVKVFAMDINNPAMNDSASFSINIEKNDEKTVKISDIEFCTSIKQIERDTNNEFYKNSYEVRPNPYNIVDVKYPVLGYYLEVYNLKPEEIGNKIITKYGIYGNNGTELLSKSLTKSIKTGTSVEAGMINVSKLKGGAYDFVYSVSDSTGKKLTDGKRRFFLYDPEAKASVDSVGSVSADEFVLMTDVEVDLMFNQASYIANDEEKKQFKKLASLEAKKNFLRQFWMNREYDQFNNKRDFIQRANFVESRFRTKWNQGWASDRGRVCLIYGIPEESYIERGKETEKGKPYEIWFYPTVLNGTYFVFVDESGFNNFRLVHSSHPNELHNEEWKSFLQNR